MTKTHHTHTRKVSVTTAKTIIVEGLGCTYKEVVEGIGRKDDK